MLRKKGEHGCPQRGRQGSKMSSGDQGSHPRHTDRRDSATLVGADRPPRNAHKHTEPAETNEQTNKQPNTDSEQGEYASATILSAGQRALRAVHSTQHTLSHGAYERARRCSCPSRSLRLRLRQPRGHLPPQRSGRASCTHTRRRHLPRARTHTCARECKTRHAHARADTDTSARAGGCARRWARASSR
jgi:hypothetical protein